MNKHRILFVIPFLFILLLSALLPGAVSPEQQEKINQDIETLEDILDQLIVRDSPFLFSRSSHINGIYLDGFGIIFNTESNGLVGLSSIIYSGLDKIPRVRIHQDEHGKLQLDIDEKKKDAETSEQQAAEIEKSLQKTEGLLTKFYLDYASMVKSLKETDRICVNINNNEATFIGSYHEDLKVPIQLQTCVNFSELQNFRRGKINETKLRSLIKIERLYEKDQDHDIEIMERILDKSLEQESNRQFLSFKGQTHGVYFDGFGAVFFSPLSFFDRLQKYVIWKTSEVEKQIKQDEARIKQEEARIKQEEAQIKREEARIKLGKANGGKKVFRHTVVTHGDGNDTIEIALPELPEPPKIDFNFDFNFDETTRLTEHELDSVINVTTDNIIKVLGQYGTALKKVKKDEYILVCFETSIPHKEKTGSVYLKVKKADIERFVRDEIDFEKFKKSVEISRS